jgi:hypothetical protein
MCISAGVHRRALCRHLFIAELNIAHFEDLLRRPNLEPQRQATILRLLMAEETTLGQYSAEHLTKLDGHIARIDELIANQRDVVAKLNGDGRGAIAASNLLDRLLEAQVLYQRHRTRVVAQLRD